MGDYHLNYNHFTRRLIYGWFSSKSFWNRHPQNMPFIGAKQEEGILSEKKITGYLRTVLFLPVGAGPLGNRDYSQKII